MYKITAPTQYNGVGYGIRFVDGVGHTENAHTAYILMNKGYTVEEIPDEASEPVFDPDKAKGDDLKKFAALNDIDLGSATRVEDIRAVVKAWMESNANENPDDGVPKTLTPPPGAAAVMGGSGANVQTVNGGGSK